MALFFIAVGSSAILLLLLQAGLIMGLSRVMGWLMGRVRQPRVIGEMLAGIMLGPSLLGLFWPGLANSIFPAESVGNLEILSQIGVVFFLFLVGLEFDPKLVRNREQAAAVISVASIAAPFALGVALTFWMYERVFDPDSEAGFWASALFMGAAVSVTAFPVLARILTERNLHRTQVGAMSITAAAVNDVVAWCMLAFVVAIAQSEGAADAGWTAALSAVYVAAMFFLVKPFLVRLERVYERQGRLSQGVIAAIFLLILTSSLATEFIGIHAMFGAFLLGCIMPKGTQFVRHLTEKIEDFTVVFLLPIFFAYTGLRTDLTFLAEGRMWGYTLLIVGAACAGKILGAAVASRGAGIAWRPAVAIGVLMNTRGLMELVILNIGRELGVINDDVFGMMVIMALVTTALTAPLLAVVYPTRLFEQTSLSGEAVGAYCVLIPISLPRSGKPLVQIADMISGNEQPRRVTALYLRRPDSHEAIRSALDEKPQTEEAFLPLLAEARDRAVPVETVSFVTSDVADDISATAARQNADLILMGFHKPVIGSTILGGTVHRVLTQSGRNVAIFVDRGFREAKTILVPYLGSQHDRFALSLAKRMARHARAAVTVLNVVPPNTEEEKKSAAKNAVDRIFNEPGQDAAVTFRVREDDSPVDVVLQQAKVFDLVIVGVSEEWGLESQLFGWRPERIARDCPTSLLIVREDQGA